MPRQALTAPPKPAEPTAQQLGARIAAAARKAMKEPAWARRQGIHRAQPSLFDTDRSVSAYEDWLRGAVVALLPPGWTWRIERRKGQVLLHVSASRAA